MARIRSTKTTRRALVALAVVAMSWTLLASSTRPAHAATFTVTNTNDFGAGSLRQAITDANNRTGADTINFNIPGDGPHTISPTSELPTITDPVTINGYSQSGSKPNSLSVGNNAVLKVELNGSLAGTGARGLQINAADSTIRGLVINRWNRSGVAIWYLSAGSKVEGNFIGTDAFGTQDLGNGLLGVEIVDANDNTIGGTEAGARNVISGNDDEGVNIRSFSFIPTGNKVMGNYIGTDKTGTLRLRNSFDGVVLRNSSSNTIGGTTAGARNIISGNGRFGVSISDSFAPDVPGNKVQGNFIGTDATGTQDLGNSLDGVVIANGSDNTIGGTEAGVRNVISGNDRHGVSIFGTVYDRVQGNFIGTDKTGAADLGNTLDGVHIEGSSDNTIGGTTSGARNVISFNDDEGVSIISTNNAATGNRILSNSIFSNTHLGIDLKGGTETAEGVTFNDLDDVDDGPNRLQNYPWISDAKRSRKGTTIAGELHSTPNTTFTIQFFASPTADPSGNGEGQRYLGSKSVTTDGTWIGFNFKTKKRVPKGYFVTATATNNATGDTSEFSETSTVQ